jgi:hypothetical protein
MVALGWKYDFLEGHMRQINKAESLETVIIYDRFRLRMLGD